jgi:hypothetical protein
MIHYGNLLKKKTDTGLKMESDQNGKLQVRDLLDLQTVCDEFTVSTANFMAHRHNKLRNKATRKELNRYVGFLANQINTPSSEPNNHEFDAMSVLELNDLTPIFTKVMGLEAAAFHLTKPIKTTNHGESDNERIRRFADYFDFIGANNLASLCEHATHKGQQLQRLTNRHTPADPEFSRALLELLGHDPKP